MAISNENFKNTSYELYLGVPGIVLNLGRYITRVEYNEIVDTNDVFALGSRTPIDREDGFINCTGSITFLQEGIDKLMLASKALGLRDYMDLPDFNITIVQERFDGDIKITTLNLCKFKNFGMSVAKFNLLSEHTININIHSINY